MPLYRNLDHNASTTILTRLRGIAEVWDWVESVPSTLLLLTFAALSTSYLLA